MMAVALKTSCIGGSSPRAASFMLGVRGHKAGKPARITPRDLCRVVNPRRQPAAGNGLTSHRVGVHRMTSPYLDRPIVPLAEALPQMLAQIEAELSTAAEPDEEQW